ncbi:MAG TPA: gliding motility-associated C-terminal domain-containing protein, partial [Chryseolinea sp.]|nr:gliding motility-associated C-terminal domain-containing protein [Chryseolinea sp.]
TLTSSHEPGEVFPIGTTNVEYKATDGTGNSSYCKFNIIVSKQEIDIAIGKIVTPDGNGHNDDWIVSNIEKFKDNKVVIVDRWGSVIYTATGYNNESIVWKGVNPSGMTVPTGTYFYTLSVRYGPSMIEKSGFIELIR